MPVVKNLEEARRLPVRVEEQQAQQLSMNPPGSAGDGRQEIQLTGFHSLAILWREGDTYV